MTMSMQAADTSNKPRRFAIDDRYEKGSAMSVIESERQTVSEKTLRLRAMRQEREAAAALEVKAPVVKKATVRKRKAPAAA